MNDVLIVVFETRAVAVRVWQQLLGAGFTAPDIGLLTTQAPLAVPEAWSSPAARRDGDVLDRLQELFGEQARPADVHVHAEALRRGGWMLSVRAHDRVQAHRAREIVQRYDAVDVDECAARWREDGWSSDTVAAAVGQGMLGKGPPA